MEINIEALVYGLILLSISLIAVYVIIKNSWGYYFSKPDPSSLGIGGKWGSYIKLKDMNSFKDDIINGDFIFFYDPEVFKSHRFTVDYKEPLLSGNGVFYPMWDNKDKTDHDFIAIHVYDQDDVIIDYKAPSVKRLDKRLLRTTDFVIMITQYAKSKDTSKDKLLPLFAFGYNSEYEILAYNTDKEVVYILPQKDFRTFLDQHNGYALRNLIYIGEKTYNVEYKKFKDKLPWTFNWEYVRAAKDIVCTLPSRREDNVVDDFNIPSSFISKLKNSYTKCKITF
jgi:hypothetical protein